MKQHLYSQSFLILSVNDLKYAKCPPGEFIVGNVGTTEVICEAGNYRFKNSSLAGEAELSCITGCPVPCKNGGLCVGINECQCRDQYDGTTCQYKSCPKVQELTFADFTLE